MGADVDDLAGVHHHDAVGALHRRQAVGDDEGGAVGHGGFQRGLHQALALGVQRAGGFIEQQQRRVLQHGAGDADALALAAGDAHAALAQKGLVALRQRGDEVVGVGGLGGGDDVGIRRIGPAVANVVQRVGREDGAVLRHDADAPAQAVQRRGGDVDAVELHLPGLHVVVAQQQLEHGALARAAGADQRHCFAGAHVQVEVLQRRDLRARRVVKGHAGHAQCRAALHCRQRARLGGVDHGRFGRQQFHQPLGGAGGAQQVAVDLRQHRHAADQNDDVDDGLAEVAGADLAAHHRLRALVQAPQQRAEGGADDEGHQQRPHPGAAAGGLEGVFGGGVEALRLAVLLRVALHHGDGVEHLGSDGAGVGHPVLAGAAELAHAAAEVQAGQHHQHQDAHHLRHHIGVGDDQHADGAQAHHAVAQTQAQAGADDGLHQRGVGGQAAEHLAGLGGLEELRALPQHMAVDGVAQVGRDALAQPAHHVEARRREHAERRTHREQRQEMLAQRHDARAGLGRHQALVDQRAQRHRKHQRRARRQHQEQPGQRDAPAVGPHEGRQPGEGLGALAARAAGVLGGNFDRRGRGGRGRRGGVGHGRGV